MRINQATVIKVVLTELGNLDQVVFIAEDYGPSKGKLTIECYGEAWSAYWGSMGDGWDILGFINKANVDYLAGKLKPPGLNEHEIDWEKISKEIGDEVDDSTALMMDDELTAVYGDDWNHHLPTKDNPKYTYLCRIVSAVKAGVAEMTKEAIAA